MYVTKVIAFTNVSTCSYNKQNGRQCNNAEYIPLTSSNLVF